MVCRICLLCGKRQRQNACVIDRLLAIAELGRRESCELWKQTKCTQLRRNGILCKCGCGSSTWVRISIGGSGHSAGGRTMLTHSYSPLHGATTGAPRRPKTLCRGHRSVWWLYPGQQYSRCMPCCRHDECICRCDARRRFACTRNYQKFRAQRLTACLLANEEGCQGCDRPL